MTEESQSSDVSAPGEPYNDLQHEGPHPGRPATGVARIDAVLADVVAVADAPVHDHVAVFERAQEELRAALDSPEA